MGIAEAAAATNLALTTAPHDAAGRPDAVFVDVRPGVLKAQSVRGAAATMAAQVARFVFQIGSQIALAHLISPRDFGLVAMVSPIVGLVALFNSLGLVEATVQRPHLSKQELSALFWLNIVISALLAVLMAACAPLVAWFYAEPRVAPITAALASLMLLSGLSAQHMAVMNRQMGFVRLAMIDVVSTGVAALIGVAAALLGMGYWALIVMQAANAATILVLAWVLSGWRPSRPAREKGVLSLLAFGGNITGSNILVYLAHNLDNVLIGVTASSAALGLYDRAYRLMLLPMIQVTTPFSRVAVPLLSRLHDSPVLYRKAYIRMLEAALLMTIPGILFAMIMAHRLVPLLLGSAWSSAAPIFAWLGLGTLLLPLVASTSWLFISQGRARQQLTWGGAAYGMIILSFAVGLPWGPVGVARAAAICIVAVQTPLLCWSATREGPVPLGALLRACLPFAAGGIAAAAVLLLARTQVHDGDVLTLAGLLIVSYAVSTATLACVPGGLHALGDVWSLRLMLQRGAG